MAFKTLRRGDRGDEVERLQFELNEALRPTPRLARDGIFGPRTEAGVLRFQRSRGLPVDGIVGRQTWQALGRRTDLAPSPDNPASEGGSLGGSLVPPRSSAASPRWFGVARHELGIHEDSRPGRHNRRIIEYHSTTSLRADTDEVPWCSSFVNWVMRQAGYRGTGSAAAKSWLEWGRQLRRGRVGAIAIIRRRQAGRDRSTGSRSGFHVAFWVSQTPTHLELLGGNQGDRVKYSRFLLRSYDIRGLRWPV